MRVIVAGSRWLGCEVLKLCLELGVGVGGVAVPDAEDRLAVLARNSGLEVVGQKDLMALAELIRPDLIVAAHCHGFISAETRASARLGCLAYHPSLLPRHRGRDAVEWTLRFRDLIAGGTLYWMNDGADTGPIALQDWVWVQPGDDAATLWRRDLGPLGLRLFKDALTRLQAGLSLPSSPQPEALATWEPSIAKTALKTLDK
jgi:methionyl-tRNA formyltransferase